eukprot:6216859-Prymnesium_polylepis.1
MGGAHVMLRQERALSRWLLEALAHSPALEAALTGYDPCLLGAAASSTVVRTLPLGTAMSA